VIDRYRESEIFQIKGHQSLFIERQALTGNTVGIKVRNVLPRRLLGIGSRGALDSVVLQSQGARNVLQSRAIIYRGWFQPLWPTWDRS
jgi:hypothetical protein